MAKKAKAEETIEVAPQPVVAKKPTAQKPVKPEWEIKDRIYYLKGNKIEAQKSWDFAVELNPDIFIPDIEVLDQYIRTQPGN